MGKTGDSTVIINISEKMRKRVHVKVRAIVVLD